METIWNSKFINLFKFNDRYGYVSNSQLKIDNRYVSSTSLVNGTPQFLDHRGSKTPGPIDIKFGRGDYVGDITPHANFGISIPKGGRLYICVKLSSSVSIFYTLLLVYSLRTCRDRTVWPIFVFYGHRRSQDFVCGGALFYHPAKTPKNWLLLWLGVHLVSCGGALTHFFL